MTSEIQMLARSPLLTARASIRFAAYLTAGLALSSPAGAAELFDATVQPYASMRYPTAGDWSTEAGHVSVTVAKLSDPRYEFLVGLHELIEAYLCKTRGISSAAVTAFDTGPGAKLDEPGDSPRAPYHREHVFATKIEREIAKELGVDWKAYNHEVENLK